MKPPPSQKNSKKLSLARPRQYNAGAFCIHAHAAARGGTPQRRCQVFNLGFLPRTMRRISPRTARADDQKEVAMLYNDARFAPKTAEEHEKDAYGATYLTGDEARKILAAHAVPGRSKLDAQAARSMACEQWPDDVRAVREAKAVRYRWLVAHGLGVSYTELAEIERRAGVEALPEPGSRGSYASAEDVAKVYAVAAAYCVESHVVRIRVSVDDMADARAANEVYERLQETYECTPASIHDLRRGGRAFYFEAIVPKVPISAE